MGLPAKTNNLPTSDSERFETLFDQHHQAVLAYSLRRSASPEDAADALAETFTIAWRKLSDAPNGEAARWWLFAIARHSIGNARRSGRRREALASAVAIELSSALAEVSTGVDAVSEDVESALAVLRDDEREVLMLHAWEELKPREIADVLGIGRAAARTRLHRAKKTFIAAMDEQNSTSPIETSAAVPREEMT